MKITNNGYRGLLSSAIALACYLALLLILNPIFIPQGMMGMMASPNYFTLNVVSLVIGACIGFAFYLIAAPAEKSELKILKKALSEDEKAAISEIEKANEITQDSLRFRLGWSKAKTSAIISNLDRMNLVQRERQGKTYKVFIQKNGSEPSDGQ